jgi:cytochrome c peroxidase
VSPVVKRNSPTILNVAFNGIDVSGHVDPAQAPMFWDSRVRGLEAQALAPIESLEEMRGGREAMSGGVAAAVARVARVRQYQVLFKSAFGSEEPVTAVNLSRAIAAFERTLITPDTRFDRYLRGDRTALNQTEVRGMTAFASRGCAQCHNGPMLSDYQFHVLSVTDNPLLGAADPGADNQFAFRTPTLRNLAYTAPYFHSGMTVHLDEAVGFYRVIGGGGGLLQYIPPRRVNGELVLGSPVPRDKLDPLLRQVNISASSDFSDIVAFLDTLNGAFDRSIPPRVPSGLRPGGR